jgi:hypothetical protein
MTINNIDPEILQQIADDAQQAQEASEAFRHSNPLPPARELQALAAGHRKYLDLLDEIYGPPSEEIVEAARKRLKDMSTGT